MSALEMEFAPLIGSQLTGVSGTVHVEKGKLADESPLGIWLEFDRRHLKGLEGTPDGEGLVITDAPPRPLNMGEAGEVVVRDLAHLTPFARAVGMPLRSVWKLSTTDRTTPLGFIFGFGGLLRVMVLNWGDQIEARLTLPPDAQVEEIHELLLAGSDTSPDTV
jgi:hypothetical protein